MKGNAGLRRMFLLNLILGVELIRPGILSSFIFENQSTSQLSHDEHVTEGVAVVHTAPLNRAAVPVTEDLPHVGVGLSEPTSRGLEHWPQIQEPLKVLQHLLLIGSHAHSTLGRRLFSKNPPIIMAS